MLACAPPSGGLDPEVAAGSTPQLMAPSLKSSSLLQGKGVSLHPKNRNGGTVAQQPEHDVPSSDDYRAFRTSLLARRFPGLKDMRDEDIAPVILLDKQLNTCDTTFRSKTYPKSEFKPAEKMVFESACGTKKPFHYINPYEAKAGVVRKPEEAFSNMFSPYCADHDDYAEYKSIDEAKRLEPEFIPPSPSQAKKTIRIKSFLTSADEETLAAEQSIIKTKAAHNISEYKNTYRSRRGQRLV